MKNFDIEAFIKDLDKQFNDMQDKAIAGSENVATASWVIKNQQAEIESLLKFINERGETGQLIIWKAQEK
jgi:peptidoglycan hydrolase CwlO-like protein